MAFDSDVLLERLQALTGGVGPARWLVAFSGGLDSSVLLHALASTSDRTPVVAIHIDHRLHPDSATWSQHAEAFSTALGVEFIVRRVSLDPRMPQGLEAAARDARYQAFYELVEDDDCLLSAHHESDQAETLLLNLMRGSGPAGLAGIGVTQPFGHGQLLRPLLGVSSDDIAAYASVEELTWIEDPSNTDDRFDRNFIRREVMPLLRTRWSAVDNRLMQSSSLLVESSQLLRDLADIDIEACGSSHSMSLERVRQLPEPRQRNLLRRAVQRCGLPIPPATRLYEVVTALISARRDAQPVVRWPGAEIRRYLDRLFVQAALDPRPDGSETRSMAEGDLVDLGRGLGRLRLVRHGREGLDPDIVGNGLKIHFRQGGESLRIAPDGSTRKLKKLFQEAEVLPWMRDRLPLLYAGDTLVAVADLWLSADHIAIGGFVIDWQEKPAIKCPH
ncbi:MAG: tRNA lysidine(34) synthetase TilS [Woeseiaceae bacterium]|nr:tRNA lysidine(34) synthetase TilS [Woeseiaceae bacterium]